MKYFQCSKCKKLLTVTDDYGIPKIVCDGRRMRELSKDQFDHETAQRAYITGGAIPENTILMSELNA